MERYENRLVESRVAFSELSKQLAKSANRNNLGFFLIYHSALGVSMTKPLESWIRKSGKRCRRKGYTDLGEALIAYAKQETGHHKWMLKDTKDLVSWWSEKRGLSLNSKHYLRCSSEAVKAYANLHETTIKSDAPFGQLAIGFEIERVSVIQGFTLIKACIAKLGLSALRHTSFIRQHAKSDRACASMNRKMLQTFLEAHPEALPEMVNTGKAALQAYGDYLKDCFSRANEDVKKYGLPNLSVL